MTHETINHTPLPKEIQTEQIKQQEIKKQQAEAREFSKAINRDFTNFSPEEKKQLLQLILNYSKLNPGINKRQLYINIHKLAKEHKGTTSDFLKKYKTKIEVKKNDIRTINNKKEKLNTNTLAHKKDSYLSQKIEKDRKNKETINEKVALLKESYKNLAPQLKTFTPEQLQSKTAQLGIETQKKLQKQGINPQEYASFLLSRELIDQKQEQSPQTLDFLESLKSLESTLGIRAPDNLPMPGIDKDYIRDNPSLIQHIKTSPDFNTLSGPINFGGLKTAAQNFQFVKTFGDEDLIKLQNQISSFFNPDETLIRLIAKNHTQYLTKNKK